MLFWTRNNPPFPHTQSRALMLTHPQPLKGAEKAWGQGQHNLPEAKEWK